MNRKANKYSRHKHYEAQQLKGDIFIMDQLQEVSQELQEAQAAVRVAESQASTYKTALAIEVNLRLKNEKSLQRLKQANTRLRVALYVTVGALIGTIYALLALVYLS